MKMRNSPFHGASGYTGLRASNFTFKKCVSIACFHFYFYFSQKHIRFHRLIFEQGFKFMSFFFSCNPQSCEESDERSVK